jgi:hypothetical protein
LHSQPPRQMLARVSSSVRCPLELPACPKCSEPVDIKPALKTFGYHNAMYKKQGIRCRTCNTVLTLSQWRVLLAGLVPFALFILPLIWLPTPPKSLRLIIGLLGIGPMLILAIWPITPLYRLKDPGPFADVRSDDEIFE